MGRIIKFADNGLQVHMPNPEADPDFHDRGDTEGWGGLGERIPVLYYPGQRAMYLGAPGWYHGDAYAHHKLPTRFTGERAHEGYFNGGPSWGRGQLSWYEPPSPQEHQEVQSALEQHGHEFADPNTLEDDDETDWS